MKKEFVMMITAAMGAVFITGFILKFTAGEIGKSAQGLVDNGMVNAYANEFIGEDTADFEEGCGLLAIAGGVGVLLSGCALYKVTKQ